MTTQPSLFADLPLSVPRGITWRRHPWGHWAIYEMLCDGDPAVMVIEDRYDEDAWIAEASKLKLL